MIFCSDFVEADDLVFEEFAGNLGMVDAWEAVLINKHHWIRLNIDLLSKMAKKNDAVMARTRQFYLNLSLPVEAKLNRPLPSSLEHVYIHENGNDTTAIVEYTNYGLAKFGQHMTPITHNGSNVAKTFSGDWTTVCPDTLRDDARDFDLKKATQWGIKKDDAGNLINFPNGRVKQSRTASGNLRPGKIDILDDNGVWIEQTWHHHENGIDLMPVPSRIHNFLNHSGGFAARWGSNGTQLQKMQILQSFFHQK